MIYTSFESSFNFRTRRRPKDKPTIICDRGHRWQQDTNFCPYCGEVGLPEDIDDAGSQQK